MGIFHFRGQLLEAADDGQWRYRYFPDCVMAKDVMGVFSVNPTDWSWCNEQPADAERKGLVSTDEQCITALVGKLRSSGGDLRPPDSVLWMA